MTMIAAENIRRLSTRKSHGRVTNAIASMLRKQLSVPQIFIRPKIFAESGIDVLAVDRAGSGDLHGVEIRVFPIVPTPAILLKELAKLKKLALHFKYLAINTPDLEIGDLSKLTSYEALFDPTGIGRFGVIAYDDKLLEPETLPELSRVKIVVRPERFLVRGEKLEIIEKYLHKTKPDIEVRL